MFKLPNPPSSEASTYELADFMEYLCWVKGGISAREIVAYLGRVDDNEYNIGCEDSSDRISDDFDEVMAEIERRELACQSGYPFKLQREGTVLHLKEDAENNSRSLVYLYLLLCTRLNMKKDRTHVGLDGTKLLEILSARVLKNYLGGLRAQSMVFGTAQGGGFEGKVNELCRALGEGGGFRNRDKARPNAKDDRIDTVGWVPFSDNLPGKLVIFGQCKTGTEWKDSLADLRPLSFISKWMIEVPPVVPIRAFFIAEDADKTHWVAICCDAGLFFDRCRIVDFCDGAETGEIKKWTLAVKRKVDGI